MKDTTRKIIIVIVGICLNVLGGLLAGSLNLPIWFDMVGTCIASYFVGIWGGVITGILGNLIYGVFDAAAPIYALTSVAAAVMLHIFIKKGYMNHILKAAISSFWLGILCVICSTPLNLVLFDGYSGNVWGDTLVDMLRWYDVSHVLSALAGEAIIEIIDKQICVLAAYGLIHIMPCLKKENRSLKKALALILATGTAVSWMAQPLKLQAAEETPFTDNFMEKIYNNTNGMVSSEANIISETDDGYIWIGSYAGLTRYDGNKFEFIREGGLVNVGAMMTDSRGRLWIGTNDAGIARYEDGKYTYFTEKDGLPANSIRCFAEDADGNVYVGTSGRICRFNTDDTIEILSQDVNFAKAMVIYHNMLIVMDNNGSIYALTGENKLTIRDAGANGLFYYCLAVTSYGLMAGTESGELFVFDVSDSGLRVKEQITISAKEVSAIFEDSKSRIWIATESDFGYLDENRAYQRMSYDNFDSSIVCFHEDYQGNIWIASTRYGVMKLSESRFINILEKAGIGNTVVNAVTYYEGDYFCGTDKGLIVLDGSKLTPKENELTGLAEGCRVRAFLSDTVGRLWICTYSGLICYDPESGVRCYDMENDGTTSDRFRCITELNDGTMAVGTADGINFIKNGQVTGTITAEDGMNNTQILSIVEGRDKIVWAGSDGSGIYIISDGKLIENYTVENGLSSNIVLRIVPHEDGYLVVTSNALCHIDMDGTIRKLANFPYFNNYDIIIDNETAYITCSAGMYEAGLADLCADSNNAINLYSAGEGLISGLTANSWNYLSPDGKLYLCSNNGVTVFNGGNDGTDTVLKFGIVSVSCAGTDLTISDSADCIIPSNARNISIHGSVRNYAFADVKVRFFVKELEDNPRIYDWNEMESIQILKPDSPQYHICFQILDSSGETVLQEKEYTITRETQMWETSWYKIYLTAVCFEIFLFIIINVAAMVLFTIRKNELEKLQIELERKVNDQTEQIRMQQQKTKEFFLQTVAALSEAVDAKDRYTSGHSKRVAEYAQMIALRMGKGKEEQEEVYRAGLLHDVGKIRVPEEIINKAGKLTEEEFNIIKIHPVTGYHILRGIAGSNLIAVGAKHHHERYDGKGYPDRLAGEKIPEIARILGVADAYDAMTSNRSYRKALSQEIVRKEIEQGRGTQFDPAIADIMLRMIDEDKNYTMKQADTMHRTILIVDDEAADITLIKEVMSDEAMYKIVSAINGKEALELLTQQSFDLILLDVNMPDMDVPETIRLLRNTYQTPIALIMGDRDMDTFAEFGCDDYITKPFQPLLLKEVLHNMLERTIVENKNG